jgi:hypothetical protein
MGRALWVCLAVQIWKIMAERDVVIQMDCFGIRPIPDASQ